jgi:DMSO/TMAO reductase YedYZ molybdopterin-dependent catalytic subunit
MMVERTTRNKRLDLIIGIGLALALVGVIVWSNYQRNRPIDLQGTEIREYQGQQLSSVATDFRENSIKGPQFVDRESYRLRLTGLVDTPLSISYDDLTSDYQNYQKVVTLYCVEGWDVRILWEGLKIEDLLNQAGAKPGANTVIFHAADGYTSSLPLTYLIDNDILLAYKMNGITIPPERGFPLQLVAESKWGYKWVKWITEIELSNDPAYQGYWESRGYSDSGNLGEGFFK